MLMNSILERNLTLTKKLVVIDGAPGCGKTMLSSIIGSLNRVEILKYAYEIEHLCAQKYLNLIDEDTCENMIRIQLDLITYNIMMSRDVNFRLSDLSSVFNSSSPLKYILRALRKGDEEVPDRITREDPITHIATHGLLALSEPLLKALGDKVLFIKFHRHPLYMIKQNTLNMQFLVNTSRHFTLYVKSNHKGPAVPFYASTWADLFLSSNPKEKAIYYLQWLRKEEIKFQEINIFESILELAFEFFVLNPYPQLEVVANALKVSPAEFSKRIMRRERVPRVVYSAGRDIAIYRRVGWVPPTDGDLKKEMDVLKEYAISGVSKKARETVDWLCEEYESKVLSRVLL